MNFKKWLQNEGLGGTSAAGEIGGFLPMGPNDDRNFASRGIRSATTATDQARRRFSGLKRTNDPLNRQQPKRVAAGFI